MKLLVIKMMRMRSFDTFDLNYQKNKESSYF